MIPGIESYYDSHGIGRGSQMGWGLGARAGNRWAWSAGPTVLGTGDALGNSILRQNIYASVARNGYKYLGGAVVSRGISDFVSDRAAGYMGPGGNPNSAPGMAQHFYGRMAEATRSAPFVGQAMDNFYSPYDRATNRTMGELTDVARGGGFVTSDLIKQVHTRNLKEEKAAQEVELRIKRYGASVKGSEEVKNKAVVEFGEAVERFVAAVKYTVTGAPATPEARKLSMTKK